MAVDRASRIYPLVLKSVPLNVGIAAAFDFAAEDGSTAQANGYDHSGNARHLTPPVSTPPVVQTSVGKGRDTSLGKTSASSYYQADSAAALGMAVGTGDFTVYKRIRLPSYPAATSGVRAIGRLCDGVGQKITFFLQESSTQAGWFWQTMGLTWSTAGNPKLPVSSVSMMHMTRKLGVLKIFVDGVLRYTDSNNTVDVLATAGASKCIVGNSGGNHDVITIDETYWNRALTDAEVVAHASNPYDYYENAAAANSIAISAPVAASTFGTSFDVSGIYSGAGVPSAIEVSFNGAPWTTLDASPEDGSFSGTLTGQAAGTGTLSVRWANAPAVTASVANVTVSAASISFTAPSLQQSVVPYRTFQRNASSQASVRISGAYTGTPTALQYRWGGAWTVLDAAPLAGVFDKAVTLTGPAQHDLEVRFSNSTGVAATMPAVAVGDVFLVVGQSNQVGESSARVPPVAPAAHPDWVAAKFGKDSVWRPNLETVASPFDDRTNATYPAQTNGGTPSGSYFGRLATLIMEAGVPCAFVPCALGSTSITAWTPPSTNVNSLYGAALARAADVGNHKAAIWWQGGIDTFGSDSYSVTKENHKTLLNSMIDDWFTRLGKKWFVWAIATPETGANFQAIHDAQIEAGRDNPNSAGYADMDGSYTGSIHYDTVAEIDEVAARAFAALNSAYAYVSTSPPPDTTPPILSGAITESGITETGFTFAWPAATGDVLGYDSSIDGGVIWLDMGTARTRTVTGRPAATAHPVRTRAYDGAIPPNRSAVLSRTITTLAIPDEPDGFSFTPSVARTIRVLAASMEFEGSAFWDLNDRRRPVGRIDRDEVLDITFDWSDVLADTVDQIAMIEYELDGVDSAGDFAADAFTSIFLRTPTGTEVAITARMISASSPSRTYDRTVYLKVEPN